MPDESTPTHLQTLLYLQYKVEYAAFVGRHAGTGHSGTCLILSIMSLMKVLDYPNTFNTTLLLNSKTSYHAILLCHENNIHDFQIMLLPTCRCFQCKLTMCDVQMVKWLYNYIIIESFPNARGSSFQQHKNR